MRRCAAEGRVYEVGAARDADAEPDDPQAVQVLHSRSEPACVAVLCCSPGWRGG